MFKTYHVPTPGQTGMTQKSDFSLWNQFRIRSPGSATYCATTLWQVSFFLIFLFFGRDGSLLWCTSGWGVVLSCPAACGILVPQPGIEPGSRALEGGFLTTEPPGSPSLASIFTFSLHILSS